MVEPHRLGSVWRNLRSEWRKPEVYAPRLRTENCRASNWYFCFPPTNDCSGSKPKISRSLSVITWMISASRSCSRLPDDCLRQGAARQGDSAVLSSAASQEINSCPASCSVCSAVAACSSFTNMKSVSNVETAKMGTPLWASGPRKEARTPVNSKGNGPSSLKQVHGDSHFALGGA